MVDYLFGPAAQEKERAEKAGRPHSDQTLKRYRCRDSPEVAERFAAADPFVRNGLVTRWRVRPWTTVVGETATSPVKPGG
jgi:hypothetical protein